MIIVEIILIAVAVYLVAGVIFAIPFLIKWLPKLDENAHKGTIGFKIIILPGVIVFWIFLLKKLRNKLNNEKS